MAGFVMKRRYTRKKKDTMVLPPQKKGKKETVEELFKLFLLHQ